MPDAPVPLVTLVIPCFNEERHIEACIRDVFAQDYPGDRLEVLVGDGMSTDRTRAILADLARTYEGRLRVIDNPRRLQAPGLNAMIGEAKGDIVIRMDVHARYQHDFVSQCVAVLEETGAWNVGGAARPMAESWFQSAVATALESRLAVGGSAYRKPDAEGFTDTVFPGAFPRWVFEKAGLFDPNAITNEDAELNQRILAAGGTVYVSRRVVVHYFPRDSWKGLAQQYFKYGKGRARTFLKHKGLPRVRPMIPFFMVVGGTVMVVTPPLHPLVPVAAGLYSMANLYEAIRVCRKKSLAMVPVVAAIFPVLHASHGVGFAAGLLHYLRNPDWDHPDRTKNGAATTIRDDAHATTR